VRSALVTGHLGFIGRHMYHRLRELGYRVDGFDIRDGIGTDARDYFRYNARRYDLVAHCAAVVGGRIKIDGAPLEVATDLAIDAELFQWALKTQPGNLIYFSSSAAYPTLWQNHERHRGNLPEGFVDLDKPYFSWPDQTYGWVKLTGEVLARHYAAAGGTVHVLRPFSGYGTDQDLDYPFPSFIQRALRRDDPFEIWGDGEQVRDFIHVDDVVNGALAAVEHGITEPVNLCTGIGVSFNELARLVTAAVGYEPQLKHRLDAPTGVRHRVGDPTRMLRFYSPQIPLEEGINRALWGAT
jgi:nucleoside-diphosphate-sugar epimerase